MNARARIVVVALLVAVPVLADAPATQYRPFVDTDVLITDQKTGLIWERPSSTSPYPAAVTFPNAVQRCANANQRLPTLKELLTLVDEEPHQEYDGSQRTTKMIDQSAFKRTPTELDFWTSSAVAGSDRHATVSFGTGITGDSPPAATAYVRCVTAITH